MTDILLGIGGSVQDLAYADGVIFHNIIIFKNFNFLIFSN